jgi:hypothetical protein
MESRLYRKARRAERSRMFSTYMVGTFIAVGLGQGRVEIQTAAFNIIIALFAMVLVLVLVSTTRAEPPQVVAIAISAIVRRGIRRRCRAERTYHRNLLCARSGVDAGRANITSDHRDR